MHNIGMRLDYILVPKPFQIEQYGVLDRISGSDHRPVRATVTKKIRPIQQHVSPDLFARVAPLLPAKISVDEAVNGYRIFAALANNTAGTALESEFEMAGETPVEKIEEQPTNHPAPLCVSATAALDEPVIDQKAEEPDAECPAMFKRSAPTPLAESRPPKADASAKAGKRLSLSQTIFVAVCFGALSWISMVDTGSTYCLLDQGFAQKAVNNYATHLKPTSMKLTLGDGETTLGAIGMIQVLIGFQNSSGETVSLWQDFLVMDKLLDRVVLGHRLFQDHTHRKLDIGYQQNALLIDNTTIPWSDHPACNCHGPAPDKPFKVIMDACALQPRSHSQVVATIPAAKPWSWVQIENIDPDAAFCRLPELSIAQLNQSRQTLL
jgi:hypothetical protein